MTRRMYVVLGLLGLLFAGALQAGTYVFIDGDTTSGEPVSFNADGVILRGESGTPGARIPWAKFSQGSLKQLKSEAKKPAERAFVDPFLEEVVKARERRKEIVIHPVQRAQMPTGKTGLLAVLGSPLGLLIFALVYGANIYAGYEISIFRRQPPELVCGVAAIAPLIGPLVFLFLPERTLTLMEERMVEPSPSETPLESEAPAPVENLEVASAAPEAAPITSAPTPTPASRPALAVPGLRLQHTAEPASAPEPAAQPAITYALAQFTFNRRFFETKLPGFFRVVPSEADKDLVLCIASARGTFLGKRISNINQNELYLQTFKEEATADEMIPFSEIQSVEVRHKDMA